MCIAGMREQAGRAPQKLFTSVLLMHLKSINDAVKILVRLR